MVLPASVNKATGLAAVLPELELSAHNVLAVGDAENDHAFLRASGCGAAVAIPECQRAARVLRQPIAPGRGLVGTNGTSALVVARRSASSPTNGAPRRVPGSA